MLNVSASVSQDILVTGPMLAGVVEHLLRDVPSRLQMADRGRQQVDGRGAERIARIVAARVKSANG